MRGVFWKMRRKYANYLINERTMALEPLSNEEYGTRVYEKDGDYIDVEERPLELIKAACLEGGSSYQGRIDAVKFWMNHHRNKLSVPIDPQRGIVACPTHSSKSFDCTWLFLSHVRAIISITNKTTLVVFHDGQELLLNVSQYVMEKQVNRASRCYMIFCEEGQRKLVDYGYSFVFERKRKGRGKGKGKA